MLTHKGTQVLHTEGLTLRRFTVCDAEDTFNNWASDEKVTKYLTWSPHQSVEFTKRLLEGWVSAYDDPRTYN